MHEFFKHSALNREPALLRRRLCLELGVAANRLAGGMQCREGVSAVYQSFRLVAKRIVVNRFAPLWLAAALPCSAGAMVNASLTWTASADASVTGYNIYYGGASGQYTNSVSAGIVTNAVVPDLMEGVTYFFGAKAHNAAGNESAFSNEAIFCGLRVDPGANVEQPVLTTNSTGDQLTFSLGSDAPAGATINATNGVFTWSPGLDYASTTNAITVTIIDDTTSNLSSTATLLVVVNDYLQVGLATTAVQAGQTGVIPITLTASEDLTNLAVTMAWPAGQLGTPTLSFNSPVVAGSLQMQADTALVSLQITPGQPFTASNTIAELSFQPPVGQPSAFVPVSVTSVMGTKSDASTYGNVATGAGEVVVVGTNPLLQLQTTAGQTSPLTLYGNPGANYQVQFTTNLTPPIVWSLLANHQQSNVVEAVDVDVSQPGMFYRLQAN